MNKNIVFYGERGVVNSIILDIGGDLNKEKKFLNTIVLADKNKLSWIDDVICMKYFVEPCFSEFGDPDLIIKAITNKNENYVLFIEAKLGAYIGSAVELINSTGGYFPKGYKNNSSKINIQLAYRYRFIMASKACNNESIIEEMDDVNLTYEDETKRKLKHRRVINLWNNNLNDAKKYYFIAMTNDYIEVIENEFPYDNNKIIPPIGNANWQKDKNCFGITTYEMLEQSQIIDRNFGYYCDASGLMLFTPSSSSKDKDGKDYEELKSINMDKWSDNQKKLGKQLKDLIESTSEIEMKEYNGSFSLSIDNVTILKIMACENSDQLYLCIRDDNVPTNDSTYTSCKKYRIGVGIKRVFICYLVENLQNIDEGFIKFVEDFIEIKNSNDLY